MTEQTKPTGLALLREPFPPNQISKLPKETKKQREEREADRTKGVSCTVCGGWHHKNAVHLDYVGHAALTDRLLDTDPNWQWEPVAYRDGLPAFDQTGGLWIKLTVCGVTRMGYGHAAAKTQMDPGSREKEVIGDALRNAAMRFGAALDLWHKGDLHAHEQAEEAVKGPKIESVRHAVRNGIGEDLPQDWKDYLSELAVECIGMVKTDNAAGAAQRIARDKLDSEQRTYLENKMDSKTRAAIKAAEKAIRDAFAQPATT